MLPPEICVEDPCIY